MNTQYLYSIARQAWHEVKSRVGPSVGRLARTRFSLLLLLFLALFLVLFLLVALVPLVVMLFMIFLVLKLAGGLLMYVMRRNRSSSQQLQRR